MPVQGASFYIERIDLGPKLSKIAPTWHGDGVGGFQAKVQNFLTLTHQISLFADFTHLVQLFSLYNSKTTYSAPFKSFHMNLKFQVNLAEVSLIFWRSTASPQSEMLSDVKVLRNSINEALSFRITA